MRPLASWCTPQPYRLARWQQPAQPPMTTWCERCCDTAAQRAEVITATLRGRLVQPDREVHIGLLVF
ncbi:hypothetical protein [Saccharopolyspora aridisoli]|nr:hypothetical protein [Saccharopolyspora aridisoli]